MGAGEGDGVVARDFVLPLNPLKGTFYRNCGSATLREAMEDVLTIVLLPQQRKRS